MATLLLELSLTRIFSVVFYYHMAFLAISIALFGLGAGGVFSYVVASWKGTALLQMGRLSALNGILVLRVAPGDSGAGESPFELDLALIYFTTALPFFVAGTMVSLAISETMERVNRVYFFDLLGAAGGCLLLIPLLNQFGGPNTVIAAAIIFAVAAAIWHSMAGSVSGRAGCVALALVLVAFLTYNQRHPIIDIRHAKGQTPRQGRSSRSGIRFSRIGEWRTSTARAATDPSSTPTPPPASPTSISTISTRQGNGTTLLNKARRCLTPSVPAPRP